MPALHGISLEVRGGQIVTLLGANGAGKSTALRAISGMIPIASGRIRFLGHDVSRLRPHALPSLGLVHVPEGRRVFGDMSIRDNLLLGSFTVRDDAARRRRLDRVFELFPVLAERRFRDAVQLSGGEQQMLAIGRALMSKPALLLLDEPTMGLAPLIAREIMRIVRLLNDDGATILLVEQNSAAALRLADYAYVLEAGSVALHGTADQISRDDGVARAYLGVEPTLARPS